LLERGRFALATVLYPLQRAAHAPGDVASNATRYAADQRALINENARLRIEKLDAAKSSLRSAHLESENANLRNLLAMRERLPVQAVAAELLYDARDPFTRKVIIDKGVTHGIKGGMVVMDATGVIGQVTRAYPFLAEVSLLTDKNQAIPVQVVRNGLRAVAYGGSAALPFGAANATAATTGAGVVASSVPAQVPDGREARAMELRFLAANADVREGDTLVTSGIDGTYLPGLPVATVAKIEREAGYAFAKIICIPSAGIDRFGQVLVLTTEIKLPPPPPPEVEEKSVKSKRKKQRSEAGAAQDASSTAKTR
jgi:rod shape-determining protein MreC